MRAQYSSVTGAGTLTGGTTLAGIEALDFYAGGGDDTVAITGTASGQGRAAALAFAREGATVVGCDLDLDGAAATVAAESST